MIAQRNLAYSATIPVSIALIIWVWIGRALFGSGGWWILIFLGSVVPALIVGLTVTTVLATDAAPAQIQRQTHPSPSSGP